VTTGDPDADLRRRRARPRRDLRRRGRPTPTTPPAPPQCQTASCGDGLDPRRRRRLRRRTGQRRRRRLHPRPARSRPAATCLVQTGVEECDDGNADDTDACVGTAARPPAAATASSARARLCDDGNDVEDDTCTSELHLTRAAATASCRWPRARSATTATCPRDRRVPESPAWRRPAATPWCRPGVEECDDGERSTRPTQCTSAVQDAELHATAPRTAARPTSTAAASCGKCLLGDDLRRQQRLRRGLCASTPPARSPSSCKQILEAAPATKDGNYKIDPDERRSDPAADRALRHEHRHLRLHLGALRRPGAARHDQSAYASKCAAVGMEVLVTRTKPHAQAFYDWNLSQTRPTWSTSSRSTTGPRASTTGRASARASPARSG
jgi:hypothetical protein